MTYPDLTPLGGLNIRKCLTILRPPLINYERNLILNFILPTFFSILKKMVLFNLFISLRL